MTATGLGAGWDIRCFYPQPMLGPPEFFEFLDGGGGRLGQPCPCTLVFGLIRAVACEYECACPGPPPEIYYSTIKCRIQDPYAHRLCPATIIQFVRPSLIDINLPPPGFCGPILPH